jgi:hypothetical protein
MQARAMKAEGYTGPGQLEYWPPDETGPPGHPHPTGGGVTALEIFSDDLKKNPAALKNAIYGDLLHGLRNSPDYAEMRDEFMQNYTPQEEDRISKKQSWWSDANGTGNNPNASHDAYIRGYLNDPSAIKGQEASGGTMYSPEQIITLEKLRSYIKTGAAKKR